MNLAEEGSQPEALALLAESLRLQPENNPAAPLAFGLLVDLRTNSRLVLRGHRKEVLYAAYSPDGSKIVTASADHTAQVWDAHDGAPLGPPLQHGDDVRMAEFNPDGTRVVTASEDHIARVWDAATGEPVGKPMQGSEHEVRFARFSPDGKLVGTGAEEGTARVWDAVTGDALSVPFQPGGEVSRSVFNPAGDALLVVSQSPLVQVRDLAPQSVPPAWLADLAEFASTQVRYDATREPAYDKIRPLRERLLAVSPGAGASWERFGRWYFLESADRPITPWSTVSLKQYVEGLIELGDRESLEYALAFTHDMPELSLQITERLGKLPTNTPTPAPASVKDDD